MRLAATLSGLALAFGGVAAVVPAAHAAHAAPRDCYHYVRQQHPDAKRNVVARACRLAADGEVNHIRACYGELRRDYVPAVLAMHACRLSSKP